MRIRRMQGKHLSIHVECGEFRVVCSTYSRLRIRGKSLCVHGEDAKNNKTVHTRPTTTRPQNPSRLSPPTPPRMDQAKNKPSHATAPPKGHLMFMSAPPLSLPPFNQDSVPSASILPYFSDYLSPPPILSLIRFVAVSIVIHSFYEH
jgi:hypothetical protein